MNIVDRINFSPVHVKIAIVNGHKQDYGSLWATKDGMHHALLQPTSYATINLCPVKANAREKNPSSTNPTTMYTNSQ